MSKENTKTTMNRHFFSILTLLLLALYDLLS